MVWFGIECQYLGALLENKKSKLAKYVNNKSWSLIFVFFNEKNGKDSAIFWHRKMTLKIRIVLYIWPSIQNQTKYLESF